MNIDIKEKFQVITASEGMVITTYKETDDIREYTSFTIAYAPLNADLSDYREISVEEDEALMAAQFKTIEEDERYGRA